MKSFFRLLGKIFFNKWVLSAFGLIALSLLIWFVGPLIAIAEWEPLTSEISRLLSIMIIILIWAIITIIMIIRSQKTNNKVVEDILDSGDQKEELQERDLTQASEQASSEAEVLKKRMNDALNTLKSSKLHKKQKLYQLPWYIIIGPPGSGKTTALLNSGLSFPLADKFGKDSIHGIGGTRNCDWWFTDQAVMIDTAGRYTTQDSHAETDSKGWNNFMGLLKKHRPRRPINGAVIAVSITDLITQTETERNVQARAIRKRLNELNQQLGMTFPAYIMFTKADLVAGFLEFFDDLGREEREQIWGMTFSLQDEKQKLGSVARFSEEFKKLIQRANERLATRLQQERDPKRRALIYEFPKQLASIQNAAEHFLKEIFAPNKYQEKAILRGVYLASGTQTGTPIDRIMSGMAKSFGMKQQVVQPHMNASKSFFLTRIFNHVIFPEADMASTNRKFDRRRRLLLGTAYALFIAFLSLGALGWLNSYRHNLNYIDEVKTNIADYNKEFNPHKTETDEENTVINKKSIEDINKDVVLITKALDKLRSFPAGYAEKDDDVPFSMRLGLYQGDMLGEGAQNTYKKAIKRYFIPYMKRELENQVVYFMNDNDNLYTALKYYLMLYNKKKMNKEEFKEWLAYIWTYRIPELKGEINAEMRNHLMEHLEVALTMMHGIPQANQQLIFKARKTLASTSLSQSMYRQIKDKHVNPQKPSKLDFKLNDILGYKANKVFTRTNNTPLMQGIPGFYTYVGYHTVFKAENELIAKQFLDEMWIYGDDVKKSFDVSSEDKLKKEVEELYFNDYISQWKGLISSIRICKINNAQQAIDVIDYITGPNEPLKKLFDGVRKNTELTKMRELPNINIPTGIAPRKIDSKLSQIKSKTNRFKNIAPDAEIKLSGQRVEDEFRRINSFSGDNGGLDSMTNDLKELGDFINAIDSGDEIAKQKLNGLNNPINKMLRSSNQLPPTLGNMTAQVANDSKKVAQSKTKGDIEDVLKSHVHEEYRTKIRFRYPLSRKSRNEVTLADFGEFFGYGGTMESFFEEHLKPIVDTSKRYWSWNEGIKYSSKTLRQFQRAEDIKKVFFKKDSRTPKIRFSLKPISMSSHVEQFLLDLNGQILTYKHGAQIATAMEWPGEILNGKVRVVFTPLGGGIPAAIEKSGTWAWFRILDMMLVQRTNSSNIYHVTFDLNGSKATFELRAESAVNPFGTNNLRLFRCPAKM